MNKPIVDESLVIDKDEKGNFRYNRSMHPSQLKLYKYLCKSYDVENCAVVSSGMNAISTLLYTIIADKKFNIFCADETYCDTPRLLKYLATNNKLLTVTYFDIRSGGIIIDSFGDNNILFIESCSNPNGYVFDFSIIPKLRSLSRVLYVIVDNTWLSHVIFNPFKLDADFVVTSLTKYYSAGTAIGGAILSRSNVVTATKYSRSNVTIMNSIYEHLAITGCHVSPYNCLKIYDNAQTIEERISKSSALTKLVIDFMLQQPKVKGISHPSCNNPMYEHEVLQSKSSIYPSVFTFKLESSKTKAVKVFEGLTILDYKTSFGCEMTRLCPYPYIERSVAPEKKGNYIVCRLAIGYNDSYERIVKGLEELLSKF